MSNEFKEGEYYVFDKDNEKVSKERIYSIVQVEEKPYAVISFRSAGVDGPLVLPISHVKGETYIEFYGWHLYADAPVLPKPIKFQIGKAYKHETVNGCYVSYTVTAKYTDGGTTYIVVDNSDVLKVGKIEIDGDIVEYANFLVGGLLANKTLKEIEE